MKLTILLAMALITCGSGQLKHMATDGDAALTVKFIEAYVGGASSADADAEALIKNLNSGDKNYLQKLAQNVVTADGQKIASALNAAKSLMSLMKSIEAKQGSNGNLTEAVSSSLIVETKSTAEKICAQFKKLINLGKDIVTTTFGLLSTCNFDGSDIDINADKMSQLYTELALINGMLPALQTYVSRIDVELHEIKKSSKNLLSASANSKFASAEGCLNKCDQDVSTISTYMGKVTKSFPKPNTDDGSSSSSSDNATQDNVVLSTDKVANEFFAPILHVVFAFLDLGKRAECLKTNLSGLKSAYKNAV